MKYTFLLRSASIFIFALLFFGAAGSAYAVDRCWDGGGSTNNWSEDTNWASDTEPGTGDVAVFDNGTCSGTPNKNATIDGVIDVQGINIVAYTGTITQSSSGDVSIGSSGYTQSSSTSTFTGETTTAQMGILGDFSLSNGTFNAPFGLLLGSDITVNGGTFNHANGSTIFIAIDGTMSISGSFTFFNLAFINSDQYTGKTYTLESGTTLTGAAGGILSFYAEGDGAACNVDGPGTITTLGDIESDTRGCLGDANVTLNGTGSQSVSQIGTDEARIPSITIDKASGTLTLSGTLYATDDWTYVKGTIDPGTSEIVYRAQADGAATITGTHNLNDVIFAGSGQYTSQTYTIDSGTTLTATGDLTITTDADGNGLTLNGPGSVTTEGNFVTNHAAAGTGSITGTLSLTFSGTNAQSITTSTEGLPDGTWTINKSSGTVTLGAALTLDGTGQDLVISSGILDMSTYALTVDDVTTLNGGLIQGSGNFTASNGNMTIGTTGWWVNNSTGDIDAEGGDTITNNGYVRWDGASAGCGGTDDIALTRNGTGAVNLAGSGRWRVYDITIGTTGIYAASPALTIYSSSITGSQTGITNNGTCPTEVTWDGGGGDTNYNTGANWTGDAAPGATDLAVLDATSTKAMTINTDPADNGFQINLGYSGTITQNNGVDITLDDQGYEQNAGTFTGGDNTSDMTINTNGDFTLNTGTFTAPAGNFIAGDEWTISGGTFTHNSGTVIFDIDSEDGSEETATITGSVTFSNVTFRDLYSCHEQESTIASGTTVTVLGALTLNQTDTCSDNSLRIHGPGGIAAKGNIVLSDRGATGSVVITINDTDAQSIIGENDANTKIPSVTINKLTGTLTFGDNSSTSTFNVAGDWIYLQGTLDTTTYNSTVIFDPLRYDDDSNSLANTNNDITGSHTLNNVSFTDVITCGDQDTNITSGTTLTVAGDLVIDQNEFCGNPALHIYGPGSISVQGDLTTSNRGSGGDITITMSGTNTQSITQNGTNFPTGTFTINKSSNTVTLATDVSLDGSGQDLTITDGALANSSYALTVNDAFTINDTFTQGTGNVSAASYTVGASANWTNTSTGDVTIGTGGVANSGTITLGDINTCGGTNNIAITSSSGGNQRSWSGSGDFNIYDVTVQDQGGSASITAYSSQNVSGNDTNWTFDNVCPSVEVQGVRLQGGNVRLRGGTKVL